jgi:hypothetical protein
VEQEMSARQRRGTDRRYRQQEYGSSDIGGGSQQQEVYQQEEVSTFTTPAMTAPGTVTTVSADWQSVDGRPALRIIPHSALAKSPIVLLSPLPAHMTANSIHPNGSLTILLWIMQPIQTVLPVLKLLHPCLYQRQTLRLRVASDKAHGP